MLKNTTLIYLEPKNRNFLIEMEKVYEVSMLDKNDLIKIEGPMRLLVDGVILNI
jgi:hypothetical protein